MSIANPEGKKKPYRHHPKFLLCVLVLCLLSYIITS